MGSKNYREKIFRKFFTKMINSHYLQVMLTF